MTKPNKPLSSFFATGSPAAVLWDMDGVLSQTMELHWEALRLTCQARKIVIPEEIYHVGTGRADGQNLAYILEKNDVAAGDKQFTELILSLQAEKKENINRLIGEREVSTTPGVSSWLEALQRRGIPCAVASSSNISTIVRVLEKLHFSDYFEAIVSGANLPQSKPHPAIFLRTAAALGVNPSGCLVIEDSPHGVEAALRAKMRCIAIGTTMPLDTLVGADIVVSDLSAYPPELAFQG